MISTLDLLEADREALDTIELSVVEELRSTFSRGANVDANDLLELAREFAELGETQDALDCFGRAIDKEPSCWEAYVGRADVVQSLFVMRDDLGSDASLGSWVCADLEKAVACVDDENRSLVQRLLVTAYLIVGRTQEANGLACESLQSGLVKAGVERSDLIYSQAFAEMCVGNYQEAVHLFRSLPREYEAASFGKAICYLWMADLDRVGQVRLGLNDRYAMAFDFLRAGEGKNYLDVARSLWAADSAAM